MIERLLYVSRAAPDIGPREVYDIVRRAHNRNAQLGLTGALLMLDGWFVQVLEGDGACVRQRLQRFGYQPGLPAAQFDGERLLQFVQACCAGGVARA